MYLGATNDDRRHHLGVQLCRKPIRNLSTRTILGVEPGQEPVQSLSPKKTSSNRNLNSFGLVPFGNMIERYRNLLFILYWAGSLPANWLYGRGEGRCQHGPSID